MRCGHLVLVLCLEGKQTIEERAIAPERLAQVLGIDVVTLGPLTFQLRALVCKLLGDAFYDIGDEAIGLLDCLPWFIDE